MYKNKEEILKYLEEIKFQKRVDQLLKKYKNKKVMIYGAGVFFDTIWENYNLKSLDIIGISDIKFDDNGEYKGFKTFAPESIKSQNSDVVILMLYQSDVVEDYFFDELFPECGKFKYEPVIKTSLIDLIKALF